MPSPPASANIEIEVIEGDRVYVDNMPPDVIPDVPFVFDVCVHEGDPVEPDERGLLLMGPTGSPNLFQVNVRTASTSIFLPSAVMKANLTTPSEPAP